MMTEDERLLRRKIAKAERDYLNMAQPYYREIARVRLIFGKPFFVLDVHTGRVIESGTKLDESAKAYIAEIEKLLRFIRELAYKEIPEAMP